MTDDNISDFDAYRQSFVARTRERLRRADRKPRHRHRYSDNVVDLTERETLSAKRPPEPRRRRWQPSRQQPYVPSVDEARAMADWLQDWERDVRISYAERRFVEILILQIDARQLVRKSEKLRLVQIVSRVRSQYFDDPLAGWRDEDFRRPA